MFDSIFTHKFVPIGSIAHKSALFQVIIVWRRQVNEHHLHLLLENGEDNYLLWKGTRNCVSPHRVVSEGLKRQALKSSDKKNGQKVLFSDIFGHQKANIEPPLLNIELFFKGSQYSRLNCTPKLKQIKW